MKFPEMIFYPFPFRPIQKSRFHSPDIILRGHFFSFAICPVPTFSRIGAEKFIRRPNQISPKVPDSQKVCLKPNRQRPESV